MRLEAARVVRCAASARPLAPLWAAGKNIERKRIEVTREIRPNTRGLSVVDQICAKVALYRLGDLDDVTAIFAEGARRPYALDEPMAVTEIGVTGFVHESDALFGRLGPTVRDDAIRVDGPLSRLMNPEAEAFPVVPARRAELIESSEEPLGIAFRRSAGRNGQRRFLLPERHHIASASERKHVREPFRGNARLVQPDVGHRDEASTTGIDASSIPLPPCPT